MSFWFLLPALMIHQAEEYLLPGGFAQWLNREVLRSGADDRPLTPQKVVLFNIIVGWPAMALAGWAGLRWPYISLPLTGIVFVNAWFHTVMLVVRRHCHPGAVTALLVLIPVTSYLFYSSLITANIAFSVFLASLAAGILFHAVVGFKHADGP